MDINSIYFQMIIDRNNQTTAAVDLTGLHQIGSFWINFNHDIRCLDLESLGAGDIGGEQCSVYADRLIEFIIEGFQLFFGNSSGRLQSVVWCFQGHALRNKAVTLPVFSYNKGHYVRQLHGPGMQGIRIL